MPDSTGPDGWFQRTKNWWYRRVRKTIFQWILVLIGLVFLVSAGIAATDYMDYVFSTQKFCAHTCHVMEKTVYEEYKDSKHYKTKTGVRPDCADCHVSRRLTFAMVDHFIGTGELYVWLTNDFSEPGSFEEFRPAAAKRARMSILDSDSAACKTCHKMEVIKPERIRGQNAHNDALDNGNSNCIACHYNLVHKKVEPSQEFLDAAEPYIGSSGEENGGDSEDEYSDDLEML